MNFILKSNHAPQYVMKRNIMKSKFLSFPYYVFLLPLFNVFYLYSQNVTEIGIIVVIRPILALLLLTGIIFGSFFLVTKKTDRAAFFSFLVLFSLLNYGAFYIFLKTHPAFGINFGRHILLAPAWLLLLLSIFLLIFFKKLKISKNTTSFLNVFVTILVFISIGVMVNNSLRYGTAPKLTNSDAGAQAQDIWLGSVLQKLQFPTNATPPDIYYIIPDMFAREDAIKAVTGYDNKEFIDELEKLGFYIADCSRSNYASTQLSITSSLNMNYLDQIQNGLTNRPALADPMSNSLVRASLEQLGYKTIVFDNDFGLPEIRNPDETITFQSGFFLFEPINNFEGMLFNNSFLRIFYDVNFGAISRLYEKLVYPFWQYVDTQKNIFDRLPDMTQIHETKFVFVHIMMPHPPFLIHEDGKVETDSRYYREALNQPINQELYAQGYLMQVKYVQDRILEDVKKILDESDVEPIIIIQGDHGISNETRLENLNAYYVPDNIKAQLYPTISPVNSFRIIFNGVFNTRYEILDDVSWYSEYPNWFDMTLDPERNPACQLAP
jgi:hypothetical protein